MAFDLGDIESASMMYSENFALVPLIPPLYSPTAVKLQELQRTHDAPLCHDPQLLPSPLYGLGNRTTTFCGGYLGTFARFSSR